MGHLAVQLSRVGFASVHDDVSEIGHLNPTASKPHARASCTPLHPPQNFAGAGAGKPHERESYSLQNTVAVTIMFVMHSSVKPSSRAFLRCTFLFIQTHK